MTPTEQDLARELARHPKWTWLEGMLACDVTQGDEDLKARVHDSRVTVSRFADGDPVEPHHYPDLSDPATQGCLIAMLGDRLCEILFLPNTSPFCLGPDMRWTVVTVGNGGLACPTLGEALARAWLAVNEEEPKP